jgi:hypothetical protein
MTAEEVWNAVQQATGGKATQPVVKRKVSDFPGGPQHVETFYGDPPDGPQPGDVYEFDSPGAKGIYSVGQGGDFSTVQYPRDEAGNAANKAKTAADVQLENVVKNSGQANAIVAAAIKANVDPAVLTAMVARVVGTGALPSRTKANAPQWDHTFNGLASSLSAALEQNEGNGAQAVADALQIPANEAQALIDRAHSTATTLLPDASDTPSATTAGSGTGSGAAATAQYRADSLAFRQQQAQIAEQDRQQSMADREAATSQAQLDRRQRISDTEEASKQSFIKDIRDKLLASAGGFAAPGSDYLPGFDQNSGRTPISAPTVSPELLAGLSRVPYAQSPQAPPAPGG